MLKKGPDKPVPSCYIEITDTGFPQGAMMRQRIKRRVFLMSMALATGASGTAFAKGSKHDSDDFFGVNPQGPGKSGMRYHSDNPHPDLGGAGLVGTLQGWLGGLHFSPENPAEAGKGWRLEMLPDQGGPTGATDARPVQSRPLGLAVRLAF